MPLIFRDTKGSPLTSAEADANIRQLSSVCYLQVKNYNGQLIPHPVTTSAFINYNSIIANISSTGATIYDPASNGAFIAPVTGIYQAIVFVGFGGGTVNGSSFNIGINNSNDANNTGQIAGANQWFQVNPGHPEGSLIRTFQLTTGQKVNTVLYIEGSGNPQMISVVTYSLITQTA